MVSSRAVAYIARAIGAVAGSVPRYIPGRTAANTAAPPEGMAPRSRSPNGFRNHSGRSWLCASGRHAEPAQQWRERLFQGLRCKEPCGFAAALGRRCRVAHNSTGPTSISIDFGLRRGAVARAEINEATGTRAVRQRSQPGEHSPVRQYAFSSRLPRYTLLLLGLTTAVPALPASSIATGVTVAPPPRSIRELIIPPVLGCMSKQPPHRCPIQERSLSCTVTLRLVSGVTSLTHTL